MTAVDRVRCFVVAHTGLVLLANAAVCGEVYAAIERKGPITGLWWAVVTGSTVGYGDYYPASTAGRGIAAWLIVSSVVLVAVLGARVVAWLIPDPHVFTDEEQRDLFARLDRIEDAVGRGGVVER